MKYGDDSNVLHFAINLHKFTLRTIFHTRFAWKVFFQFGMIVAYAATVHMRFFSIEMTKNIGFFLWVLLLIQSCVGYVKLRQYTVTYAQREEVLLLCIAIGVIIAVVAGAITETYTAGWYLALTLFGTFFHVLVQTISHFIIEELQYPPVKQPWE